MLGYYTHSFWRHERFVPGAGRVCNPDNSVHVFALKIRYQLQSSHTDYPKTNANTPVIPHEHADGVANPVRPGFVILLGLGRPHYPQLFRVCPMAVIEIEHLRNHMICEFYQEFQCILVLCEKRHLFGLH